MQNISKDLSKESVHITNKDLDYDDILYGGWTKFSMEENILPVNTVIHSIAKTLTRNKRL